MMRTVRTLKQLGLLPAVAVVVALAGAAHAEMIDFNSYSESGLNGQDGWTAAGDWFVWHRDGQPNDHVMWNNKANGTIGSATRDFAQPLTAGILTYELRPNDNNNGNYISWILPRDQAETSYMAQIIARYSTAHGTYEFYMFVPGIAAESSGNDGVSLAFTPETVFEVKIDFDFSDTGGGARPNGTFDLQVTRLNDSTVVWTQSDIQSYQPLGNIGNLLENGGNQNAGFATWYDNINLVPEPCTLTMLAIGAGALLKRRRA